MTDLSKKLEARRDSLPPSSEYRAMLDALIAAAARPWIDYDVNEFGERECWGCQLHGIEGKHSPKCAMRELDAALARLAEVEAEAARLRAETPEWIVNDNGELGVMVHGRAFFLYKGYSLEYDKALHDDGTPMMYRAVGKREFGECCHPVALKTIPFRYTEPLVNVLGPQPENGGWKPLPALKESDHA